MSTTSHEGRTLTRSDLRNVAIVAHVDHGKTTLVDAMLRQAGAFTAHQAESVADRVMDSGDLEREKGITILAKNTAVHYAGPAGGGLPMTINIIDTPGHADFGGEVERGLSMVDGIVLLVDASEGPLPQTRFVLRKALNADMPVVLVVNKVDRSDARIAEVVDETYELFMDLLDESHSQDALDFPVVYASAKAGRASLEVPENGGFPDSPDLEPLFRTILESIPAPTYTEDAPLQAHVTNLDASPFLGRLALVRVHEGYLRKGQQVAWMKRDGSVKNVKVTELLVTEGLERKPGEVAGPGDIAAIAGIPDITIGETLADPENPVALPLIHVDEPAISMTIGTNTSPLVGRVKGAKVTARLVKDRLDSELVGNVSLRILPTERPDAWEVQGRGELALAILVEALQHLAGGELVALLARERRRVDAERHREAGLVDGDRRERDGVVRVGQRLADGHLGETGDGADLTRAGFGRVDAVERLGDVELGDLDLLDRAVELAPRDGLALRDRPVLHAAQREAAEVRRRVEVRDERLERVALFVGGRRNVVEQQLEQRLEVAALRVLVERRPTGARVRVDDRELDLGLVRVEVEEELVHLVDDLARACVGAVDLVHDEYDGQLPFERLAEHEPRRRQRPFRGVDEQEHAVDHREPALDLAAASVSDGQCF
jgi:small GTP-binding protein